MSPPSESNASYSLQPYPLKYISIINRHQGALQNMIPPTSRPTEGHQSTSSSSSSKSSILKSTMENEVSILENRFKLELDRFKINLIEVLARKGITRASLLESSSEHVKAVTSENILVPNLPPHPSTLPLGLRRKMKKSNEDKKSPKNNNVTMEKMKDSSIEWGKEMLSFVKEYEELLQEIKCRHQLESDSLASSQKMQLALLKLRPESNGFNQGEEEFQVPKIKPCESFNVAELVLKQIS